MSVKPHRKQLLDWINEMPGTGPVLGAELGVSPGMLSREILKSPRLCLLMIDRYRPDPEGKYSDPIAKRTRQQHGGCLEAAMASTRFAEDRRAMCVADCLFMSQFVGHATLDFVFIDADHSYESTLMDIRTWLPKVKDGGFISGHDFGLKGAFGNDDGWNVQKAVEEVFGDDFEKGQGWTWRHHA